MYKCADVSLFISDVRAVHRVIITNITSMASNHAKGQHMVTVWMQACLTIGLAPGYHADTFVALHSNTKQSLILIRPT
jgi:hypothetical protein